MSCTSAVVACHSSFESADPFTDPFPELGEFPRAEDQQCYAKDHDQVCWFNSPSNIERLPNSWFSPRLFASVVKPLSRKTQRFAEPQAVLNQQLDLRFQNIANGGASRVSFTMEDVNRSFRPPIFPAFAVLLITGASSAQAVTKLSLPDCQPWAGQILRCPKAGFTYKVPFGWVDRTEDMQEAASLAKSSQDNVRPKGEQAGRTLLAAFERPPGTSSERVNSAVIIAVEDKKAYPLVKTAADYFGPLAEIAEQRGFKTDGDPYSFSVGARQVVRGDFSGGDEKNPIRQTSLVRLDNGYILSFTFIAASDDDIDGLIENLSFTSSPRKTSPK